MAHIAKYKAASCGHMLAHYRRDTSSLGRENIDPTRTKDNYTLGLDDRDGKVRAMNGIEPNWATVEGRIERVNERAKAEGKRAVRKDAVVMADVVVTLPENVRKGDEDKFFGYTYWFLIRKLGKENMMGGFVHRDEVRKDGSPVRDHMHVPFTPVKDGRFNYKQMCPRSFYQGLHKELGDYLEKRMGYRPEIELGDETRAQRVYTDKSVDIDRVRGAVDRAVVRPAEDEAARIVAAAEEEAAALLKEAETRRDELVAQVADGERRLLVVRMQVDEETDRLECLRRAGEVLDGHVERLESIAADTVGYEGESRAGKVAILNQIANKCDGLRAGISKAADKLRDLAERMAAVVSGHRMVRGAAPKEAVPMRQPSVAEIMEQATRAAEAYNRARVPTQPRSQSRGAR